jgi:hypothetical protein
MVGVGTVSLGGCSSLRSTEKHHGGFGGLAFLVGGNLAISASGQGGALVRVDPADSGALTATAQATPAVMGGRSMQGWLRVSPEDLDTDEQLTEWVTRAIAYIRSLPPKR